MIFTFILLIVGFVLLIKGADIFVDGASNLALILKIPAVIVGLTIVSLGTSAPEISVSLQAALEGSADIAVSNVVGSNIFNLLACLGICSLFLNLKVPNSIIKRDIPVLVGATVLLLIFNYTGYQISRIEGIIFLFLMVIYIAVMIYSAIKQDAESKEEIRFTPLKSIVLIVLGLVGIFIGGDLVVESSTTIALEFGLSQTLVGLTIVSIGTSLPELVTSVVATKKGHLDIAVGNVIGSNVFNILLILGLSASIVPINVNPDLVTDTLLLLGFTGLTFFFARKKEITRNNGILFTLLFIAYMIFIIIRN